MKRKSSWVMCLPIHHLLSYSSENILPGYLTTNLQSVFFLLANLHDKSSRQRPNLIHFKNTSSSMTKDRYPMNIVILDISHENRGFSIFSMTSHESPIFHEHTLTFPRYIPYSMNRLTYPKCSMVLEDIPDNLPPKNDPV